MTDDTIELSIYENNGVLTHESGKSFFYADMGAHGSGWQTVLYSVKDSEPYELKLSKNLQGFKKKGETFYTSENDFTLVGHMYPAIELVLDEKTGEFTKGECLNFDYNGITSDYMIAYSQWMKKAVGTVDLLTEEFMQYTFLDIEGTDVPILVLHDWRIFYFYNFVDGKVVPLKDSEGEELVLGKYDLPMYTNEGKFYVRGSGGAPAVIYYDEIIINKTTAERECIASACYAGDAFGDMEGMEDIENTFTVRDNDKATEAEYDKIVAEIESYEQIEFMPYTFS
ncbi:MAG: hypothetical protein IJB86_04230 [Clostridia bacterium]|nr:hypothetical protein [Clostridia bacterium]